MTEKPFEPFFIDEERKLVTDLKVVLKPDGYEVFPRFGFETEDFDDESLPSEIALLMMQGNALPTEFIADFQDMAVNLGFVKTR